MRLSCKWNHSFSIVWLALASYSPPAHAAPREAGPPPPAMFLANRPAQLAQDDLPKSNDQSDYEAGGEQASAGKHSSEVVKFLDRDKSENETKGVDDIGTKGKSKHGFDSLRTNPLNLAPLNLTGEQKDKIQAMRKESAKKARSIHAALKAKRGEMFDLMFDPKATRSQILKARDQARKLHEQADDLMVQDFLAIRELLTPEQKMHLPEIKPLPKAAIKSEATKSSGAITK